MKLIFIQEYHHNVEPEWYDTTQLSGEGTLQDQILEYELARAKKDGAYLFDKWPGKVTVMWDRESCIHCLSKTCDNNCLEDLIAEEDSNAEPSKENPFSEPEFGTENGDS